MSALIVQDPARTDSPPPRHPRDDRKLVKILSGILLLAVLYTLYFAKFLLLPIAIALLLAALLQPVSVRLHKMRLPEELSSAIVVLLLIALVGFGASRLYYPAAEWFARGPHIIREAEFKFGTIKKTIREARQATRQLEEAAKLEGGKEPEVVVKGPSLTDKFLSQTQSFIVTSYITFVLLVFPSGPGARHPRALDPESCKPWRRGEVESDLSSHSARDHAVPRDDHLDQRGDGRGDCHIHGAAGDAQPGLVGRGGRMPAVHPLRGGAHLYHDPRPGRHHHFRQPHSNRASTCGLPDPLRLGGQFRHADGCRETARIEPASPHGCTPFLGVDLGNRRDPDGRSHSSLFKDYLPERPLPIPAP